MQHSTDHKEGIATVRIVYHNYRPMKDGSFQFYVCVTKQRKRKYIATGLTLHPDYWDASKERIRKSYPHDKRKQLEKDLKQWLERYENAAEELTREDIKHNAKAIAEKAVEQRKQYRQVEVLAYIDELVSSFNEAKQLGNAKVYKGLRNILAQFLAEIGNGPDISFSKITVTFCNKLETQQRAKGNGETYISYVFRTLRAVLNRAIADNVMKPDTYPFARNVAEKHKFQVGKFDTSTSKRAISREAIRLIEELQPESERLQRAKNVFLFSFYVGGINFIDLANLRWANITIDTKGGSRLNYTRQKTGGKFSMKLLAPALAIVDYYKAETCNSSQDYIFPILNTNVHKTPSQIKNRIDKIRTQVNADLKEIASAVGININLTTYVARHSFATNLKRSGVATGIIGEAMGHQSEQVTAIYLASFENDTIDAALENLL